ncbi:FAD-binding protein [Romboutsia weinsteinii]|uniref:L-aspartate oxidase n=1 Tax=Romboutsia weinsteinii TaxID=2020949 RepID=A0A371J0V7_9FIRM|nr:FAD-binding protein [Romboutsia weinsteinii]RDY26317.1 FAD-binding protein [Romboutsia weinsteinii]
MDNKVFDVIVIGSGLGGIRCTQELLKDNLSVCMVTSKEFCSGASFYPGTWGLGMIGPKDDEDKNDLLENINRVGCNLSNPQLSSILVDNVNNEINFLLEQDIKLKESVDKDGVVPCFDSNKRRWFGFDFKSAKEVFSKILDNENITLMSSTKVIDICNEGNGSKGVLVENKDKSIDLIKAKSIVIASGGYTSLFKHNFSLELDSPIVQYLAYKVGCELINLEFVQFIPAYIKPMYKTIFNERVFKYITLRDKNKSNILGKIEDIDNIMDERSTYGPFTTRLKSSLVDKVLFQYYQLDKNSAYFEYPKDIESIDDTLIYNYFKWLNKFKKDTSNKIHIAPFAHACNGGLKIDKKACTTVDGIFACGEVTGGVHGADRIGGLSTCNALVFGAIAGRSASEYCKLNDFKDFNIKDNHSSESNHRVIGNSDDLNKFKKAILEIREVLYTEASILRSEKSINRAKDKMYKLKEDTSNINILYSNKSILDSYLNFSLIFLDAMLNQDKSIGCHCRTDC